MLELIARTLAALNFSYRAQLAFGAFGCGGSTCADADDAVTAKAASALISRVGRTTLEDIANSEKRRGGVPLNTQHVRPSLPT